MSYLLWALLNFAFGILLLFLAFKAFKYIRNRFGHSLSVIGVLALIAIMGSTLPEKVPEYRLWTFNSDSLQSHKFFKRDYPVSLEKNILFDIRLVLHTAQSKNYLEIPIKAFTTQTGFTTHKWIPTDIAISKERNDFRYKVTGIVTWKLINFTVYRQAKTYTGVIPRK